MTTSPSDPSVSVKGLSASDFISLCTGIAPPASSAPARDLDIYVNVRSTRLELCLCDNTKLDDAGKPTKTRFYSARTWPKGPAEMENLARSVVAKYRYGDEGRALMFADIQNKRWEAARPESESSTRSQGGLDLLASLFS